MTCHPQPCDDGKTPSATGQRHLVKFQLDIRGGDPKDLFMRNCVFTPTGFNLSHLQVLSPGRGAPAGTSSPRWTQRARGDVPPLLHMVSGCGALDALRCFRPSVIHRFHFGKTFPSEDPFHLGKPRKRLLMARGSEWGDTGVTPGLVNNHRTLSVVWAGTPVNHPAGNGQTH